MMDTTLALTLARMELNQAREAHAQALKTMEDTAKWVSEATSAYREAFKRSCEEQDIPASDLTGATAPHNQERPHGEQKDSNH